MVFIKLYFFIYRSVLSLLSWVADVSEEESKITQRLNPNLSAWENIYTKYLWRIRRVSYLSSSKLERRIKIGNISLIEGSSARSCVVFVLRLKWKYRCAVVKLYWWNRDDTLNYSWTPPWGSASFFLLILVLFRSVFRFTFFSAAAQFKIASTLISEFSSVYTAL